MSAVTEPVVAESKMTEAESKLTAAKAELTAAESKLTAAESKWTAAESELTAAKAELTAAKTEEEKKRLAEEVSILLSALRRCEEAANTCQAAVNTYQAAVNRLMNPTPTIGLPDPGFVLNSVDDPPAAVELENYIRTGKVLYECAEYKALRGSIELIWNKKFLVPPFIMFDESSGVGKSQALFSLDFPEELFFVLTIADDQLIYRNFHEVSLILKALLKQDIKEFPKKADGLTTEDLRSSLVRFKVLEFFDWLLKKQPPKEGEHPLKRQASLEGKAEKLTGMTIATFRADHTRFLALFDEVPHIENDPEKEAELQFIRSLIRAVGGVCIFSGTDSICANMITQGGARDNVDAPWALLWMRFPPSTLASLSVSWKPKIDAIMETGWKPILKQFLTVEEGKYFNRPWFIVLFIECLDLELYPTISETGLRATCRVAFQKISIAKGRKGMFRPGQLKLLHSAYTSKDRDADWLVTSHFAHVAEGGKESDEVWLFRGTQKGPVPVKLSAVTEPMEPFTPKSSYLSMKITDFFTKKTESTETSEVAAAGEEKEAESTGFEEKQDGEWGVEGGNMEDESGDDSSKPGEEDISSSSSSSSSSSYASSLLLSSSSSSLSSFSSSSSSASSAHDLCAAARSKLVLSNGIQFRPVAVFPSVQEEPLLHLFCADDPFLVPRAENLRYPLCKVVVNPSDPGEIPARTQLASSENPNAHGSDGKLLESFAAAAMCIASHRSLDEFGCPPFVFLEHVVFELLGTGFSHDFKVSTLLLEFVGELKVPYALPPQAKAGTYSLGTIAMVTMSRLQNALRYDIAMGTHLDSFLDVSAECKDWDRPPPVQDLLLRTPTDSTHKWLRLIFCQKEPERPELTDKKLMANIVVAKLVRRHVYIGIELVDVRVRVPKVEDKKTSEGVSASETTEGEKVKKSTGSTSAGTTKPSITQVASKAAIGMLLYVPLEDLRLISTPVPHSIPKSTDVSKKAKTS